MCKGLALGVCAFWLSLLTAAPAAQPVPTNPFKEALALSDAGRHEEALAAWTKYLGSHADDFNAYLNRGLVRLQMHQPAAAIADFDLALRFNQRFVDAYYLRGEARRAARDLPGALRDYTQTIILDAQHTDAYEGRAICHYLRQEWGLALNDFVSAGKQEDASRYSWLYACVLRQREGEDEAARFDLLQNLQREDAFTGKDWFSSLSAFLAGKITEAELVTKTEDAADNLKRERLGEAWYFAGMMRLARGQKDEAAECFRKCIAMGQADTNEFEFASTELKALKK